MAMYCPRCANAAVEGQRFCRNCGMNLDVILNAMEGKQPGPLDFERLKRDLRDLGANLRTGFEEASNAIKGTNKLNPPPPAPMMQPIAPIEWKRELDKALHKVRAAHTRKYSLQQATLSLFGGGVWMAVWYHLLDAATQSRLLSSLELIILQQTGAPVVGLVPVIQLLWLLGLIPIARGLAHLINGIFLAPKAEKYEQPTPAQPFVPSYNYGAPINPPSSGLAGSTTTNELAGDAATVSPSSVTEEETVRFGTRNQSQM